MLRCRATHPALVFVVAAVSLLAMSAARKAGTPTSMENPAWLAVVPRPPASLDIIRVRVIRGGTGVEIRGQAIRAIGAWRAVDLGDHVTIRNADGRIIADAAGVEIDLGKARTGVIRFVSTSHLVLDGMRIGASAMLSDRETGGFDVVAPLPIDTYIAGVLMAELYRGWPAETYLAQAVAARSYAAHERALARLARRGWDIDADTTRQAFRGLHDDPVAWNAARATRSLMLTQHGQTLRAYYSSTCGGRSASARDNWNTGSGREFNAAPALQGAPDECPCRASPRYRWERRTTPDILTARLSAWGKRHGRPIAELTELRAIEMTAANPWGRPTRYAVHDVTGVYELTAEELRLASNMRLPNLSGDAPLHGALAFSTDLDCEILDDVVIIRGRGFGHGVGLCQFGAREYARQGLHWPQILERYYPGADLVVARPGRARQD
ncbi:MAG: SpoIID/LytB domain-containing protein [Phycisphaeraceae bacterium]|nr:SpoIID/LytB domain-containing protein [Phycisphaeraceae bacterium]